VIEAPLGPEISAISYEVMRLDRATPLPVVVWRLPRPLAAVSSAPLGGGLGLRSWVVNAQVGGDYSREDPDRHLEDLAAEAGLSGAGVGMLTAASVEEMSGAADGGARVWATVGTEHPTWAAAGDGFSGDGRPGTINVVAFVPARLSDAALVNSVVTVTEAKVQALFEAGVAGTGTASDAVCVLCERDGIPELFCGPRSHWGARLARATYGAVAGSANLRRREGTTAT
jgi:adenosylcobinamide hydrolase